MASSAGGEEVSCCLSHGILDECSHSIHSETILSLLSKHAGKASLYSPTSRLPLATTGRRHSEHRGLGSRYSHNKISSQPDQGEKGVLQGSSQGQALATKCPQVSSLHSTDVTLRRDGVISKGIALEGNKTDKNRKSVYLSGINSRVGEKNQLT